MPSWTSFDEKIIALYARGMTTREIAEHIGELDLAGLGKCGNL
jgi:transposase-like protein